MFSSPEISADSVLDQLIEYRLLDLTDLRSRPVARVAVKDLIGSDTLLVGPGLVGQEVRGKVLRKERFALQQGQEILNIANDVMIVDFERAPPEPPKAKRLLADPKDGAIVGIVFSSPPSGLNSRCALSLNDVWKRLAHHMAMRGAIAVSATPTSSRPLATGIRPSPTLWVPGSPR